MPPERELLERDGLLRPLLEVERDREEPERDLLVDRDLLAVERRLAVEPPDLLAGDFRVLPPLELEAAAVVAGTSSVGAACGGAGAAGGALEATAFVRPPATATNGRTPSSASAISAPTAMAIAAARPKKIPILRLGEPANIRQRIKSTARTPRLAVIAPRWTGTLTLCPAAAR